MLPSPRPRFLDSPPCVLLVVRPAGSRCSRSRQKHGYKKQILLSWAVPAWFCRPNETPLFLGCLVSPVIATDLAISSAITANGNQSAYILYILYILYVACDAVVCSLARTRASQVMQTRPNQVSSFVLRCIVSHRPFTARFVDKKKNSSVCDASVVTD